MTRSLSRALARLLVVLFVLAAVPLSGAQAADAATPPGEPRANYLWARSNELRDSQGLRTLKPLDPVMSRARRLAARLAARGVLEHSDLRDIAPSWTAAGENIGRSGDVRDVTARLFRSPSHRQNILDARFTHTGVGTARSGNGTVYVVQLFWRG